MKPLYALGLGALALACLSPLPVAGGTNIPDSAPLIDSNGKLVFPTNYREWVFLSSGLDMSYSPDAAMAGQHIFNNVFVPRAAFEAFLKSGTWPEGTVLVLENRSAATNQSILKHGQIQTDEVVGLSAHMKDSRLKDGWGFYSFEADRKPATEIPHDAACYSCHQAHAAVDTTFVQFYPTLMPIAANLHTLSAAYLAESSPKH
jgi:hypothetical protein